MSLVKCKSCGNKISQKAEFCPFCAEPKKKKTSTLTWLIVALSVLLIYVASDSSENTTNAKQTQLTKEQLIEIEESNVAFFSVNKNKIILSVKSALEEQNYHSALSQTNKYLASGDEELNTLNAIAKAAIKTNKTKQLLAELKKIPVSQFEENLNRYQDLVILHPNNKRYKSKVDFYTLKAKEAKDKRSAAMHRTKRIEEQFSSWDGSHRNLERVIKNAMNDPDSYEHSKTVYWDKGSYLIVRTEYRGKNAFGGIVKNFVKAKVSMNGDVLQILEQ